MIAVPVAGARHTGRGPARLHPELERVPLRAGAVSDPDSQTLPVGPCEPRDPCRRRDRAACRRHRRVAGAGVRAAAVSAQASHQGAVAWGPQVKVQHRGPNGRTNMMRKLLCGGGIRDRAFAGAGPGGDRQHPDGGRSRHRIRQDAGARVQEGDRHRRQSRGRQLCRDAHQARAAAASRAKGSYSAIVVDFYWVGEFTKAGWLQPLDDRIEADKVDTSVYVPKLMDLVGKVDGITYMLPFYNYAMGLLYRTDLLADEKNKADFKAKYGMELAQAEDLGRISEAGRVLHQGRHARRGQPGPAARSDRHGMVELSVRQWRRVSRRRTGSRRSTPRPA